MCLSIPSKILEIDELNSAVVETLGVKRRVSLDLISEPLEIGDYVLIHVGFAMEKIDIQAAQESLKIYADIAHKMDNGKINDYEGDMGLKDGFN
ncbi:HypC/HybG/HupF family hydrogenase formation chaperone [Campylobacter sp.]|uniref:HypC/HybG/HupF family hydrogenase formation chaperone n=1 Tax=Campylobacter sp. TaxID=205 RepID=UPI0025B985EC|nr:HypC/HybG/HupF family hydrogenase formation chaperone [Campylobacter sp.]